MGDLFPNPLRGIGNIASGMGDWATNLLPNAHPKSTKTKKKSNTPEPQEASGINQAVANSGIIPGTNKSSNIFDGQQRAQSKPVDPLLSQLQFFQLVMPFLQQTIQQATHGLQSTAQQYSDDMSGVISNMPESLQSIYSGVVPNVTSALNNQASASAQSALAQPEYQFMMGLIDGYRQQQEQALQQQMMIDNLQRQLAAGGGQQEDSSLTSLIASMLQPDANKKKK